MKNTFIALTTLTLAACGVFTGNLFGPDDGGVGTGGASAATTTASGEGSSTPAPASSSSASSSSHVTTTTTTTGSGGAAPVCAHDVCSGGIILDPSCDPCIAAVCQQVPSLHCCDLGWSLSCAGAMESVCGKKCGDTNACAHSVCEIGGPLDGSIPNGCSLCVAHVCVNRPSCCTTAWDDLCVQTVAEESCDITCP